MRKIFKKENLPLVLLALAIVLSPSFVLSRLSGGKALEIRAEDILLVILGFFWFCSFLVSGKTKMEKPPLFGPILLWLGAGFFSVLLNWILGNIQPSLGFFYFLKEIEYFFLYFYVYYHIRKIEQVKLITNIWVFIGLINAAWIIYELVFNLKITYYYGPTPFIEPEGTFPGGGFFMLIFIFLFNIFLYYHLNLNISNLKKIILGLIIVSPAIGVVSSGSRGSFAGMVAAFLLTLFLYYLKKGFSKAFFTMVFVLLIVASVFILFNQEVIGRFSNIKLLLWELNPDNKLSRIWIWRQQLSEIARHPLFFFFGLGKSVVLEGIGESHSQYVRNFVETGIVGSIFFLLLIRNIIKKSINGFSTSPDKGKESFFKGISAGLLGCTFGLLVASIFAEGFLVVKISEVYWFLVALALACLQISGSQKLKGA